MSEYSVIVQKSDYSVTTQNSTYTVTAQVNQTAVIEVEGTQGPAGPTGATGAAGQGVVTGGTLGQVLAKKTNADYDTEWIDVVAADIGAVWGNISGTLSNQTDLQNALNAKLDSSVSGAFVPYVGAINNVNLGDVHKVTNAIDPTADQDYSTKKYTDELFDIVTYSQYGGF